MFKQTGIDTINIILIVYLPATLSKHCGQKNIVIIHLNTVNIKIHLLYENKHNLHTNIL